VILAQVLARPRDDHHVAAHPVELLRGVLRQRERALDPLSRRSLLLA
jgi:hypothetical protein